MQERLQELVDGFKLTRKEHGPLWSKRKVLGTSNKYFWMVTIPKHFDKTMNTFSTVTAYLANPCVRTELQVLLSWCLMRIKKKMGYETSNDSKSREQDLKFLEALRVLIARHDSAITWVEGRVALCFVRFVVDRIPTPLLEKSVSYLVRNSGT